MTHQYTKKRSVLSFFKSTRFLIAVYDLIIFLIVHFCSFYFFGAKSLSILFTIRNIAISFVCLLIFRLVFKVYSQIWRYGNVASYIRLILSDTFAMISIILISLIFPNLMFFSISRLIAEKTFVLLACLTIRMIYRYSYKNGADNSFFGKVLNFLILFFGANQVELNHTEKKHKINIGIIGAGIVGMRLAEDLHNNPNAVYEAKCFIDISQDKIGRQVSGLPVVSREDIVELKDRFDISEVVLAIPDLSVSESMNLFSYYKSFGYNMKVFDETSAICKIGDKKKNIREFDIEDILFRKPIYTIDEKTQNYYKNKIILITGGGGSIGSEMCRQIAKCSPKQIIVLDVYENGVYDIQQEIKSKYGSAFDFSVEIMSVCDKKSLETIFEKYRPQIVIHAAAHKHVPLMEHNCCEAVKNNVFGTLNTVELSEKYGVERFMMVSTDKAVNPTNVMGATKRMCEMIVLHKSSAASKTIFTATRFGNVLGSAGSVVPLFKKQIESGGPVTLTDKRIIRYFMTIPEASQLVLTSGLMAKNGELFVLDMGRPVKIIDLAENMIRLSGLEPNKDIEIKEIGLRPGEKLYEELLVKTEQLDKTENKLIFIERESPISKETLEEKLSILRQACESEDNETVKQALFRVIPTYKTPEEVNAGSENTIEFKLVKI